MSAELAVAEVRSIRPALTRAVLDQATEDRKLLGEYIKREMIEGTDYGVIEGTKNKTLWKPGAEKLTDLFRCTAKFVIESKTEDWDRNLFHYVILCRIVSRESDVVVAEGYGSCNSREGKYRWRVADRTCPGCGKPTILRSKYPPRENPNEPPGWYCYGKKGGCGANFRHDDPTIIGQDTGRVENDDVPTLINTVLKMAKKRALVDAAIALARCSDTFTQDVGDAEDDHGTGRTKKPPTHDPHDPPDAAAVEEIIGELNGCRYSEDAFRLAEKVKADKRITDAGRSHLRPLFGRAIKELPKTPATPAAPKTASKPTGAASQTEPGEWEPADENGNPPF